MKRILTIVLSLLFFLTASGTNRALLICVGDYPDGSGWRDISSANDKAIIEHMLLQNNFRSQNISVLQDSRATAATIKNALLSLSRECEKGDVVYIHFSCHGQQVTDLDGDAYWINSTFILSYQ